MGICPRRDTTARPCARPEGRSFRRRWRSAAVLAGALVCTGAMAGHDADRLEELVDSGRYEQAYELADAHLAEHAGEARYDFYYGVAAVNSGHLSEGVFALERVLIQQPTLDRARLEYARGLFLQEDDVRARREFQAVLANAPPPAVVSRIERYLAALDRRADRFRTTVTGWLETGLGHTDNVNRAPSVDELDLGFGTLVLGPDQQEREAAFLRAAGGTQVNRPLVPGLNVIAGVDGSARSYDDESEFNTGLARARLGLRSVAGVHRLSGFFRARRFYVGGEPYQRAGGVNAAYVYQWSDRTALYLTGRATRLRYDDQEVRDAQLNTVGFGISRNWAAPMNPSARLMLFAGEEDPKDDTRRARALAGRDIAGLRARFALAPAPQWSLEAGLQYRESEYETNTFPFSEARESEYYNFDLTLEWRPTAHWRIGPRVGYSESDANIGLYDYERTVVGIRARYTFF